MSVLLIQLAGPMQAWGTQSRFGIRDTGLEPSKSGVVGLLASALGRPRNESVEDLAAMTMAVRVDREGTVERDFHTVSNVARANGRVPAGTVVSNRYYLADAWFTVALEGEPPQLLESVHNALNNPRWPLFLGRKSFPPALPLWLPDGLTEDESLSEALHSYPWAKPQRHAPERLRIVRETTNPDAGGVRMDQPLPLSFQTRQFAQRSVSTEWVETKRLPLRDDIA